MVDPNFCHFRATEVFGLYRRGLVFRGFIERGCLQPGDQVCVVGTQTVHHAQVIAIEHDRKIIGKSVPDVELGLLLNNFDDPNIANLLGLTAEISEDSMPPSAEILLGLTFPLIIHSHAA